MRPERRASVTLAALAFLASAACSHTTTIGRPVQVPAPPGASAALVRAAVLRGLEVRRFRVLGEEPGAIVARQDAAGLWMQVRVRYDDSGYAIHYDASEGFEEQRRGDRVTHISPRYHRYVAGLRREIDHALVTMPIPSVPSPPPDTVAAVPPSPPTASDGVAAVPSPDGAAAAPPPPDGSAPVPPPPDGDAAVPPPPPDDAPVAAPTPTAPPTWSTGPSLPEPTVTPPPPEAPPRAPRRMRPLWEVFGPGVALFGASWIASWTTALAVDGGGELIGWGFFPVAGPWAQLPYLQWSRVPRWMGISVPILGLTQAAGLILLVVGAAIQIPESDTPATQATWTLTPAVSSDGASLSIDGWF